MKKLFLFGAILALAVSCTPDDENQTNYDQFAIDKEEIKDDDI